jgi:flagellar basal-body rod modification protein FlgD
MDLSQIAVHHSSPASQTVASALGPHTAITSTYAASTPEVSGSAPTTATPASDPSTITASDFLTLLVTELQNQDPTQPTDPNAYITQLVGVNSLQQLISIDHGITALGSIAGTTSTSNGGSTPGGALPASAGN